MARLSIDRFSTRFRVRALTGEDIPLVYALCRGNPQFYACCGRNNTEADIRADMEVTPPGKTLADKYYVGFFDGETLAAVMDLIDGYPDPQTAYVGFFMMNGALQGRGIGTRTVTELFDCLRQSGFRRVRLAFDKENPQSSHFWRKNGFTDVREVPQGQGTLVLAERRL